MNIAHLLLSWNYGVLMLTHYVLSGPLTAEMNDADPAKVELPVLQQNAVFSMSRLAARFAATTREDTGADGTSWQSPPLVARNSNIPLVTAILSKFLAYAVASSRNTEASASRGLLQSVRLLLKSLLTLTRTVGGLSGPQTALRSLMAKYPDDLMGVWADEVVN